MRFQMRHFYWILTSPSFAVQHLLHILCKKQLFFTLGTVSQHLLHILWKNSCSLSQNTLLVHLYLPVDFNVHCPNVGRPGDALWLKPVPDYGAEKWGGGGRLASAARIWIWRQRGGGPKRSKTRDLRLVKEFQNWVKSCRWATLLKWNIWWLMPLFLIFFYFTDWYWDEYVLLGVACVWTWGGLEACLFWSCIDVHDCG